MKILHLLSGGNVGGIEILCREIAVLSDEKHEFCFLYSGGVIAEEIKRKKIPVYYLYEKNMVERLVSLIKLVKEERYDTIIVHHEGVGIYSFYLVLTYFFNNIKFIKYLHCAFDETYFYQNKIMKDWLSYQSLNLALKRSQNIIAVSNYVKNSYCQKFNLNENKVSVIYNGIQIRNNLKIKNFIQKGRKLEIRILFIGRLVELKGVEVLLFAVKKLLDSGEKVYIDILGEGKERLKYQKLVEDLGMKEKVVFHGQVLEKKAFFEQSDIFVCPSICQEAFGISIVEAMAEGQICIASKSGGIPEIIDDGVNGYLFDIGNAHDLAEKLKKVISILGTHEHERIILQAYNKVLEFSINNTIEKLHEICK